CRGGSGGGRGGGGRAAEALPRLEVAAVGAPAERPAVEPAQAYLDERHAVLHQSAGQQAALAEQVAAVGVADGVLLLVEVERLAGVGAGQAHGPLVGRLVRQGRDAGVAADEVLL